MTSVRVYVNGKGVDAPAMSTAVEAVRLLDPGLADAVRSGSRALTDSRGLHVPDDAPVYGGAIFRVVSGRVREASDA
ncbi:MAG: hypothetical protein IT361_11640 [Gemmatimonadaceae bacterium]|nr:hypothetical protein [Gemmatimonadaceae bacterium]